MIDRGNDNSNSRVNETGPTVFEIIYDNRNYQFWLMQLAGWGGLCIVTFLSLTLWYNTVEWSYISHTVLQAILGLLLSIPLHRFYVATWGFRLWWRGFLGLLMVTGVSLLWTVLRILTFMALTGESGIWEDFGGWYFSSFLVYLCWTALYFGNRYYFQLQIEQRQNLEAQAAVKEEQLKRMSAEADARDSQLSMLRYQLNPHFLFNTLNTINALVKFGENDKAQSMITQLGRFLRYSLDNNPAHKVSLQQEIDALMLYLDIELTRFGERLKIEFDIDDKARDGMVPSLLLQPLAENAIKYAISVNEDGGVIGLVATVQDSELRLEMKDTGPGQAAVQNQPKRGRRIGLKNTLQRLQTLYNDAYVFDIGLRECGGLIINIRIPYERA